MSKGSRLHLSYERMALLVSSAPAYTNLETYGACSIAGNKNKTDCEAAGGIWTAVGVSPFSLRRIQDVNYSFNYNAQQLREIGSFEYIKDRNSLTGSRIPIIAQPQVELSFSYLLYDAFNEEKIGLKVNAGPAFSQNPMGIFTESNLYQAPDFTGDPAAVAAKGDVNFFLLAEPSNSRKDIVGRASGTCSIAGNNNKTACEAAGGVWTSLNPFQDLDLIGFGNCYLNSYSLSASVGNFVQCNLSYACSNLSFDIYDYNSVPPSPAVNGEGTRSNSPVDLPEDQLKDEVEDTNTDQSILALRPGDLEVILTNNKPNSDGGFNLIDLNAPGMAVQSVDVNINIERKDINGFGSNYIKDRKMQFPILCELSFSVLAREFEDKVDIENIFRDDIDFDVDLMMYIRDSLTEKREKLKINIKNAKLNSESHSANIGSFYQIQASFVFEITPAGGMSIEKIQ